MNLDPAASDRVFSKVTLTRFRTDQSTRDAARRSPRVFQSHADPVSDWQWLRNGGEVWLRMQAAHDLWHAERQRRPRIVPARKVA